MKEPQAALEYMDAWRASVIQQEKITPIIDVLCDTKGPAAGVGAHLANDILYLVSIHPDTPATVVCLNEQMYSTLKSSFPSFMAQWISLEFKKRCGGTANSVNPFAFNYTSNTNFLATHVKVFRQDLVRVPRDLYNIYQGLGHFDEAHTVGEC